MSKESDNVGFDLDIGAAPSTTAVAEVAATEDATKTRLKRNVANAIRSYLAKDKTKSNEDVLAHLDSVGLGGESLKAAQINSIRNRLGTAKAKTKKPVKAKAKAKTAPTKGAVIFQADIATAIGLTRRITALAKEVGGFETLQHIVAHVAMNQ